MPKYSVRLDKSLDLGFFQSQKYFQSQNIDMYDDRYLNYTISLITINLRSAAVAWHQEFVQGGGVIDSTTAKRDVTRVCPVDIQERLRENLDDLKQNNCRNLEEYSVKFCKLISNVRCMNNLDRVMCFTRGLVLRTRQEVLYQCFQTTTDAIAVARKFERSHSLREGYRNNNLPNQKRSQNRYESGDDMEICNSNLSKAECFKKNLCFYCKSPGHKMSKCNKRKQNAREARVNHAALYYEYGFRKEDESDLNVLNVLIDSGADYNIILPSWERSFSTEEQCVPCGLMTLLARKKNTNVYKEDIVVEGETYKNVVLTECEFPEQQDVILGKPWLVQFNPSIDWRTTESSCLNQFNRWS
ncbi:hypothetical protein PsorP6_000308 [Peronosclerospora sorghi]|uniref:Uncharacterized protein n=1 Tax=Peronosclerospora sorghi TaxID=230839 RepID=A0ACC0WU24_9STRA|nr:hypothetical protein PsorP6_000308 [Peronosclerospora sorghi]